MLKVQTLQKRRADTDVMSSPPGAGARQVVNTYLCLGKTNRSARYVQINKDAHTAYLSIPPITAAPLPRAILIIRNVCDISIPPTLLFHLSMLLVR